MYDFTVPFGILVSRTSLDGLTPMHRINFLERQKWRQHVTNGIQMTHATKQ